MVAGNAPGVPRCRSASGDAGEPVRGFKDGEISTGGAEELRGEDRSEAGHAEQGLSVPVFGDFLADQRVEVCEFLVQGDDFLGEGGGDLFPEVLGRDSGVLGFRGVDGGLGDRGGGAGAVFLQPGVQPCLAGAADPVRGAVFGEQQRGSLERL